MPEGRLSDKTLAILSSWVNQGGELIVFGRALHSFAQNKDYELKELPAAIPTDSLSLSNYGMKERNEVSDNVSGAIFPVEVDKTHPLAYGYSSTYFSLSSNSNHFYLADGDQVGKYKDPARPVSGFAGSHAVENKAGAMALGVEYHGEGKVIYLTDNPLFRSFWENGKLLVFNAVFRM